MKKFVVLILWSSNVFANDLYSRWETFGGGPENIHYSSLKQIHRNNVHRLKVAWTFDSGDVYEDSTIQCNPIVIDDTLYGTTPTLRVVALNAGTGQLLWSFDGLRGIKSQFPANRGVTYWREGKQARIFVTLGSDLISLDARTGQMDRAFGNQGMVDLRDAFGHLQSPISISVTTPGVIYQGLLILGSVVPESLPSTPGDIRAYDVRTGKICWTFHTIPRPGDMVRLPGQTEPGGTMVERTTGRVWLSTWGVGWSLYLPARLHSTFTERIVTATICLPTRSFAWRLPRAKENGICKTSSTTSGI